MSKRSSINNTYKPNNLPSPEDESKYNDYLIKMSDRDFTRFLIEKKEQNDVDYPIFLNSLTSLIKQRQEYKDLPTAEPLYPEPSFEEKQKVQFTDSAIKKYEDYKKFEKNSNAEEMLTLNVLSDDEYKHLPDEYKNTIKGGKFQKKKSKKVSKKKSKKKKSKKVSKKKSKKKKSKKK